MRLVSYTESKSMPKTGASNSVNRSEKGSRMLEIHVSKPGHIFLMMYSLVFVHQNMENHALFN